MVEWITLSAIKRGMLLFCQLDVTGRTKSDPAAATQARRMLDYVSTWKPGPRRQASYVGAAAGHGSNRTKAGSTRAPARWQRAL